jgi:hypothetical protein
VGAEEALLDVEEEVVNTVELDKGADEEVGQVIEAQLAVTVTVMGDRVVIERSKVSVPV